MNTIKIKPLAYLNRIKLRLNPENFRWYNKFQRLSMREQIICLALVILLGFCIILYGILLPLYHFEQNAKVHYQMTSELNQLIQQHALYLGKQQGVSDRKVQGSLLAIVNSTAKEKGLSIKRFDKQGENSVRIRLNAVGFNVLIQWLFNLEQEFNIRIESIFIDRYAESGKVNASMTLNT